MFYYNSHMGGVYCTEMQLEYEDLYCDECGDSDWEIGEFESFEDFLEYYAENVSYYGSGGYLLEDLIEWLCEGFNYEKAEKIVERNRDDIWFDRIVAREKIKEEFGGKGDGDVGRNEEMEKVMDLWVDNNVYKSLENVHEKYCGDRRCLDCKFGVNKGYVVCGIEKAMMESM